MLTRSAARSMRLSRATRFDNVKCVKPDSFRSKAVVHCPVVKPVGVSSSSAAIDCSSHTGFTCNSPFSYLEQMCTKIRCYRLNLEEQSNVALTEHPTLYCNRQAKSGVTTVEGGISASSGHRGDISRAQALSCSHFQKRRKSSTDSAPSPKVNSRDKNADSTANIFRGVTATNDGTIISQNTFVKNESDEVNESVHNNGASRQIAVINEAVKLVDRIFDRGSANLAGSSKILSLHIMGEYEDFLSLVHDGTRRLQSGKSLTDEAPSFFNRRRNIPHCVTPINIDCQKKCFLSFDEASSKRKNNSEDWAGHSKRIRQCSSASKLFQRTTKLVSIYQNEQKRVHQVTTSLKRDHNHLPSPTFVTAIIDRANENDSSAAAHRSAATKKRNRSTITTVTRPVKRRRVCRNLPKSS